MAVVSKGLEVKGLKFLEEIVNFNVSQERSLLSAQLTRN